MYLFKLNGYIAPFNVEFKMNLCIYSLLSSVHTSIVDSTVGNDLVVTYEMLSEEDNLRRCCGIKVKLLHTADTGVVER